jgi:hypothetical protein
VSAEDKPKPDTLVRLVTLAREWDIPPATLRTWRHRGYGPESFLRGSSVVYRRSVVEAWLKEQEQNTSSLVNQRKPASRARGKEPQA